MDFIEAKEQRRQEPEGGYFDFFSSFDRARIRYGYWPIENPKGTVVILGGRTEFIEKFFEDMHLWQARGYSVAAMDWRGQGMSKREHKDYERHYILDFDDHIKDLKKFFDHFLTPEVGQMPIILMAHSAGSHCVLRFLHDHGDLVDKAITVSPMIKIDNGPVPDPIMVLLPKFMIMIGQGFRYAPGHTGFKEGRWGWRRKLTHDDERFEDEDYFIHNKDRRLAVGGVTYRWFIEAMKSCDLLNSAGYGEAIDTPVLMFQAGSELIVDNAAMTKFAARVPAVKLVEIEGSMHEILKETDEMRAHVWSEIDQFMADSDLK